MVTIFDIIMLTLSALSVIMFKINKNSAVILLSLAVFFMISMVDLSKLNNYYYVVICFFELLFIALGLVVRVKASILVMFLISLSYNVVSFIEYSTKYSFFYSNYTPVMQLIIISLLLLIYKDGLIDGFGGDHNSDNHNDTSSFSRFFCRSAL